MSTIDKTNLSSKYSSGIEKLVLTVQQLSLAQDLDSVMKIVRKIARELTGADGATFVLRENGHCYYADEDAISPLWKGSRFPINSCISGWAMLNKKPAVIEDIYQDERIPQNAYRPTFVKSLVMVPIRTIDPLGAIGNYWASTYMPSEEDVLLLQSLADITAVSIENINIRSQLESNLQQKEKMLTQIQKQKNSLEEFCGIISHNLRAPLSNLMLINDMLQEESSDLEKSTLLEDQKKVLNNMKLLTEKLISTTQIMTSNTGKVEEVHFKTCFEEVIQLLKAEVDKAGAKIVSNFSEIERIRFPKKYLESIFINLLSNSIKYGIPDRASLIQVRSYLKKNWIYLEFRDNGSGMDLNAYGDKIFKLGRTFHKKTDSRGFGLFQTKTQLAKLGGDIYVESLPKAGSVFTLKLCDTSGET